MRGLTPGAPGSAIRWWWPWRGIKGVVRWSWAGSGLGACGRSAPDPGAGNSGADVRDGCTSPLTSWLRWCPSQREWSKCSAETKMFTNYLASWRRWFFSAKESRVLKLDRALEGNIQGEVRRAGGFGAVSRVRASPRARQGPKAHQGARGPSALRTLQGEASPGEGVDRGQSSDERAPPSREGAATRSAGGRTSHHRRRWTTLDNVGTTGRKSVLMGGTSAASAPWGGWSKK